MAEDSQGVLMAADAKIGFDDNASFRHKELHAKRDETQEDPREVAVCARTRWTHLLAPVSFTCEARMRE